MFLEGGRSSGESSTVGGGGRCFRSEPECATWSVFVTVLLQVSDKNGGKTEQRRKELLLLMLRQNLSLK